MKRIIAIFLSIFSFFVCTSFSIYAEDNSDYDSFGAYSINQYCYNNGASFLSSDKYSIDGYLLENAHTDYLDLSNLKITDNGTSQRYSTDLKSSSANYGTTVKNSNSIYRVLSGGSVPLLAGGEKITSHLSISTNNNIHNNYLTGFDFANKNIYFSYNSNFNKSVVLYLVVNSSNTGISFGNTDGGDVSVNLSSINNVFINQGSTWFGDSTFYLWRFEWFLTSPINYYINFSNLSTSNSFRFLYFGAPDNEPSDYYSLIFGEGKGQLADFSSNSNFYKDSTGSSSSLNSSNIQLSSNVSSFNTLESSYTDSMNDNFSNVSTDSGLLKQNGFVKSAQWVSTQFNNLANLETADGSQPFKLLIVYSLILGIALILLGKVRS